MPLRHRWSVSHDYLAGIAIGGWLNLLEKTLMPQTLPIGTGRGEAAGKGQSKSTASIVRPGPKARATQGVGAVSRRRWFRMKRIVGDDMLP